jgi:hypothetical protein
MNKRVFWKYGAAGMAAVALCIGFTACELPGNLAVLGTETDSDKVSEEKVTNLFDELSLTNAKVEILATSTSTYRNKTVTATYDECVIFADDLMFVDSTDVATYKNYNVNVTAQAYTQVDGENINYYIKNVNDDMWHKTQTETVSESFYEKCLPTYEKLKNKIAYDEEKDGYVAEMTVHNIDFTYVLKYENEQLSSITATGVKETGRVTGTVEMEMHFTYGGQSLTLPTDYVDDTLDGIADSVLNQSTQDMINDFLDEEKGN